MFLNSPYYLLITPMKSKRKVINVSEETYNKLKAYCNKNGLKINWIVEKLINEFTTTKKLS